MVVEHVGERMDVWLSGNGHRLLSFKMLNRKLSKSESDFEWGLIRHPTFNQYKRMK